MDKNRTIVMPQHIHTNEQTETFNSRLSQEHAETIQLEIITNALKPHSVPARYLLRRHL